uniref:DUF4806 domain-containing protein n=1 Tax=Anopheles stephensi TaxID=30069 RepID=A0A182YFN3_ANOST
MDRQAKKGSAASKQKQPEQQDEPEELDYDSEDVMIEFIKVECGRNPDADPFITNVEAQDGEMLGDNVFAEANVRTRRHKLPTPLTRDQTTASSSKKSRPMTPETAVTEAITSDKSIASLFAWTEQRLTNLETSLMEINGKLDFLGDQFQSILQSVAKPAQQKRPFVDIGFKAIDSLEQLEAFNAELAKPEYEEKVVQWLEGYITEGRSEHRMSDAMDVLFTRKFLTHCSWTGIGKGTQKIAMMQMTNVTRLFQRIGTTPFVTVNHKLVAIFFMKKLKNAFKRVQAKGLRSTIPPCAPTSQ